jgi:hypothetical protein
MLEEGVLAGRGSLQTKPSRLRNPGGLSDLGQNAGTDVNVPNGLNLNPNPAIAPAALSNRTMPRFPAVGGS